MAIYKRYHKHTELKITEKYTVDRPLQILDIQCNSCKMKFPKLIKIFQEHNNNQFNLTVIYRFNDMADQNGSLSTATQTQEYN